MSDSQAQHEPQSSMEDDGEEELSFFYRVRFREEGQEFTGRSRNGDLEKGSNVLLETDNGNEPAKIITRAAGQVEGGCKRLASYTILRRLTEEEEEKYSQLPIQEESGFQFCRKQVEHLKLPMQLVRVERFFNGSKIIFYFTAENRVDFRELVKILVQEFRTRVEMRQIGVRHETQMIGGLGSCGRELCCSSFLKKFESVSIKMAKTQDLPLNPAKISGVCNRLLCCLTYEYDNYRSMKKGMPKVGRSIRFEGTVYKVTRQVPLTGSLIAVGGDGEERTLSEAEWRQAEVVQKPTPAKKGQGKKSGGS